MALLRISKEQHVLRNSSAEGHAALRYPQCLRAPIPEGSLTSPPGQGRYGSGAAPNRGLGGTSHPAQVPHSSRGCKPHLLSVIDSGLQGETFRPVGPKQSDRPQ